MVEWFTDFKQDFLIRWKKNHLLVHQEKGTKKTHLLARSFKGKSQKQVWDKERKVSKTASIDWTQVAHPEHDTPLWLIIIRDKNHKGNSPIYLLTSIPITDKKVTWEMALTYMHRWEIEQAFRFNKSELAIESIRLIKWENRLKLLAIVTLIYDFLLNLMRNWKTFTPIFLRKWCHRTGNRYKQASIPIYRFRAAIANCLKTLFSYLIFTQFNE